MVTLELEHLNFFGQRGQLRRCSARQFWDIQVFFIRFAPNQTMLQLTSSSFCRWCHVSAVLYGHSSWNKGSTATSLIQWCTRKCDFTNSHVFLMQRSTSSIVDDLEVCINFFALKLYFIYYFSTIGEHRFEHSRHKEMAQPSSWKMPFKSKYKRHLLIITKKTRACTASF